MAGAVPASQRFSNFRLKRRNSYRQYKMAGTWGGEDAGEREGGGGGGLLRSYTGAVQASQREGGQFEDG